MHARLDFDKVSLLFEIFDHLAARLEAIHAGVLSAVLFADGGVVVHHLDDRQVVALADLEVIRIVRRGDLHTAGAEIALDVFVGNDRDLAADERQDQRFSDKVGVAVVLRVNGDGGIAEHRFGAGGRHGDEAAFLSLHRVADVPEIAVLLGIFDLGVREGGAAMGAPVDDAEAAVDEPFIIEVDEHLAHGFGTALVHREALVIPIAGRAEFLQLVDDARAVLLFPVPDALKEFLAAEVVSRQPLVDAKLLFDLDLRGDAGVVGAGDPEGGVALHPLVADEDVLKRFVERVPHVKLPGHVRGRNDDREGLFLLVGIRLEVSFLLPFGVDPILKVQRIVVLRKFFTHII